MSMLNCMIGNKYRLDALLGAGGMGTVYRATRLLIGDEVAIKILHGEQNNPQSAERFRREAQAAARLKHPNVITIYDFGFTDDGLQYLVMELAQGQTLREIVKCQGSLTPSASAAIFSQVCDALDKAHNRDVVHRDIKPDNIIIDFTGKGLQVKVLDFGIAKLRDSSAGNLTQTGSVIGTPHYMSPEQCLGEELDSRSDIYSLGVVLFEMLTGTVPFNSPTSTAVVVQHVSQMPPSLRAINISISVEVEEVVLRALAKKRNDRQQTAGELAEQLAKAVESTTAQTSIKTRLPLKPSTKTTDTSTVVLQPGRSIGEEHQRTPTVTNKTRRNVWLLGGAILLFGLSVALWGFTQRPADEKSESSIEKSQGAKPLGESAIAQAEVEQFVESWRQAWETENLFGYSNCYDESFVGRNFSSRTGYSSMTLSQWMNDKEKKFRILNSISIQIGPRTIKNEGGAVSVSFGQAFRSDKYSDNGQKTLYLRRTANGEIKIVQEDFVPARGAH